MTDVNLTSAHNVPDRPATRAGVYLKAVAKTAICAVIVHLPPERWAAYSAVVRRLWRGFSGA